MATITPSGNSYFITGYPLTKAEMKAYQVVAAPGTVAIRVNRQDLLELAVQVLTEKLLEEHDALGEM